MSSLPRSRGPRKTAPAPTVRLSAPANFWPAWTDNWLWEPGADAHDLASHVTLPPVPEPDETDAEFLARLGHEEEIEKARVLANYQPSPTDLAEYAAWSEALDAGTLPPAVADQFRPGEYDAPRRGQVTEDELAQLAAHGAI
jgi:hypothetical protein